MRLLNAQVVNGCQTVHSLWHALRTGRLEPGVEVLVRIIEQPDPDFVPLVTRYNNTQNAVRSSDLVGRDTAQLRLQRDLDSLGYYYETRRGDWRQYYSSRDERVARFGRDYRNRVIRLGDAAKACAAFYLQQPVIAKNKTVLLTTLVSEQGIYEDVFDADTSAQRIIGAVELMRRITQKRKAVLSTGLPAELAEHSDWLPHADFYILALIGLQYLDPIAIESDDHMVRFFGEVDARFDSIFATIVKRMGPFLHQRSKEPGYSHPKFLKTESSWRQIRSLMGPPTPIQL